MYLCLIFKGEEEDFHFFFLFSRFYNLSSKEGYSLSWKDTALENELPMKKNAVKMLPLSGTNPKHNQNHYLNPTIKKSLPGLPPEPRDILILRYKYLHIWQLLLFLCSSYPRIYVTLEFTPSWAQKCPTFLSVLSFSYTYLLLIRLHNFPIILSIH